MSPSAVTPSPLPTANLDTLTDADLGPIPGLLAFVMFVLLAAAVYVLYRSMTKQLRRIDFPEDGADNDGAPSDGSAPAG